MKKAEVAFSWCGIHCPLFFVSSIFSNQSSIQLGTKVTNDTVVIIQSMVCQDKARAKDTVSDF